MTGVCQTAHHLGDPTPDRKSLIQTPHEQEEGCQNWSPYCPEESSDAPISDEWLKSVGFRWDEWERSGGKHWTLWFGNLDDFSFSSFEDLGIEVNHNDHGEDFWFCWLRSDCSHKYARFIHLRHIHTRRDLIDIIVGITGLTWNPANHLYGSIRRPKEADYIRESETRLDRRIMKQSKWADHEKDESQMRPAIHNK